MTILFRKIEKFSKMNIHLQNLYEIRRHLSKILQIMLKTTFLIVLKKHLVYLEPQYI